MEFIFSIISKSIKLIILSIKIHTSSSLTILNILSEEIVAKNDFFYKLINVKLSDKKMIGIGAGKGGVGKSSTTVNLAFSLQKKGYHVGILDADIYGPSIPKMISIESLPKQDGEKILPARGMGLSIISAAFFRKHETASFVRAPIANHMIEQFVHVVDWSSIDILLIDLPPGTGDIQLTLMQNLSLSSALLVTTPQQVATLDVEKAYGLFKQMHVPILGVIENMSYFSDPMTDTKHFPFGKGGGAKLADTFALDFLGEIPIDPAVSKAGDEGLSLFDIAPNSLAAQTYAQIADHLTESLLTMDQMDIEEIENIDSINFRIKWADGQSATLKFAHLQRNCPCMQCKQIDPATISDDLTAEQIERVGRYAVRCQFKKGCSKGIYPFDYLRKLAGIHSCE